ncbi:MAG TPA: DNA translocase FtsK, partial [Gemmatimonadaceae bacterium]|nr:DNA translocase FtsK [Gemmatimonadaceae bacterium]
MATTPSHRRLEAAGVALLALALFLALAIASSTRGAGGACGQTRSLMGPVGACARAGLVWMVGVPAAFLVPLLPAIHALRLFGRMQSDTDRNWLLFVLGMVLLVPVTIAMALHVGHTWSDYSGFWGGFFAFYLLQSLAWGAWIFIALVFSALTIFTLAWNPVRVLLGVQPKAALRLPWRRASAASASAADVNEPTPEEMPAIDPFSPAPLELVTSIDDAAVRGRRRKKSKAEITAEHDEEIAAAIDASANPDVGDDELPPAELLTPPPPHNAEANRRELDAMALKLKEALGTFRVDAEITGRTTGPVVTQYEVEPAPGVKVRQIANLSNDLALAMRAASIRIVAPIPGRGAVGVEVPNPTSEIVAFREMLESREFQTARAALPIALGKDLEGKPVIADLAKMPHLLIAGATGSGKSVCVNTIITGLIYRHTPRTLRFLMVDPKMVELSVYNVLPHLRHKVITDNRDAASVLKWAKDEMQERYELLAANQCRNIQDFNRRVQSGAALTRPRTPDVAFEDLTYKGGILPYIVVIIDEMADLMMTVQSEVETPIAMLAQKARAIGIHLILATQRPSVNVITGLIKA